MTIAVVQSNGASGTGVSSVTLGAGVTAGNWLLIAAHAYSFGVPVAPVTPALGGTALTSPTLLLSGANTPSGATAYAIWLYQLQGGDAGATAVSFTGNNGGNAGGIGCFAVELSAASALALDVFLAVSSASSSGTATIGPTSATSAAGFALATLAVYANTTTGSPSGWTLITPGSGNDSAAGYESVSSGATPSMAMSVPQFYDWCGGIVVVKESGGGTTVSGAVSALSLAAPAGSLISSPAVAGPVSALALAAPAGSLTASSAVAGPVSLLALNAPAGQVVAGTQVNGAVSPLALAAPAGTVTADVTVAGQVSVLTLAAPAGTPQSSGVTINGVTANLALVAPAGSAGSGTAASALPQNVNRGGGVFTESGQPQGSPLGSRYVRQPGG